MNTPLDYYCKICNKPGVAYYDANCPINDIELWRKCICCERCYTFRDRYITAKRAIEKCCAGLRAMRQTINKKADLNSAENKIKELLFRLTKKCSKLCSDYYRIQDVWADEIVYIIMDKPEGCNRAIDAMHQGYISWMRNHEDSNKQLAGMA